MPKGNDQGVIKVSDRSNGNYKWATIVRAWTGRPEFALFFPEKIDEDTGELIPAIFVTNVAINTPQGKKWLPIKLYGRVAESANEELKIKSRVAQISCEGRWRYLDSEGNPLKYPFVSVKCNGEILFQAHRMKQVSIKSFQDNPFAHLDTDQDRAENQVPGPEVNATDNNQISEIPF